MIKNNKILIIAIALLALIIFFIPTYSYATNPIDYPNYYEPGTIKPEDTIGITEKANKILSVISTIGITVAVIALMILGIKYMIGSVEEKAEYKKSMIPYIIGILLLVSTSAIVGLIAQLTQEALK